jgi:hypothetical protein
MDCLSEIRAIPGLRPRRPKGLRRPTKEHPLLGTMELVREERCHSWQVSDQLVPSRLTLIDGILQESEDTEEAVAYLTALRLMERRIRENVIRARYFEFVGDSLRSMPFEQILEQLDGWMAPYRFSRWSGGTRMHYDCSDTPGELLVGARQIEISIDRHGNVDSVHFFDAEVAHHLRVAAYVQRIVPEGCGLVADSIADQFVVCDRIAPTPELAALLDISIAQTADLLEKASSTERLFLREALALLCETRDTRFC